MKYKKTTIIFIFYLKRRNVWTSLNISTVVFVNLSNTLATKVRKIKIVLTQSVHSWINIDFTEIQNRKLMKCLHFAAESALVLVRAPASSTAYTLYT